MSDSREDLDWLLGDSGWGSVNRHHPRGVAAQHATKRSRAVSPHHRPRSPSSRCRNRSWKREETPEQHRARVAQHEERYRKLRGGGQ